MADAVNYQAVKASDGQSQSENCVFVLVLPAGSIDPMTGTGQRTMIIFESLKKLGKVLVIILSEIDFSGAESFFSGAESVKVFEAKKMAYPPRSRLLRGLQAIRRLMSPHYTFSSQEGLREAIVGQLEGISLSSHHTSLRILVFRYARTFAISGFRKQSSEGMVFLVDVDDRDDKKIDLQIRNRVGSLVGRILALAWKQRFTRHLEWVLSGSSAILLAKAQDRFDKIRLPQIVLPNTPFREPTTSALTPADDAGETILFVGVANYSPNLAGVTWFLRACWPAIRAARPAARFRIVGLGDWSALPADLAAQPGVEVVGGVDDLAPEYGQARAAICPILEGAGSQIKVIEACAYGRPVVSTAFASGGFGPEIERALSVASDPAGFAQACIDLLADPARAARRGATLRALQQATHSREAVENLIVTTLTDLVASVGPHRKVPS